MNLLDLMVKIGVDDQASDKVGGISSNIVGGLGKAVAGVAKLGAAATAAAAGAATVVGKMSVDSFAQFEQLSGGAELMFGSAYDYIEQRSQEAYKNVQMSQNEYLQQVNGFAVGLKTALGGNEQAAAQLADRIVTAEADIVAATGNTAENVQNAFNGVMRGNYTMLDNLGLGISATKEGMQEVIDTVNQHNAAVGKATNYTIDNVADVQNALVDYVEMQGMAGYAAGEAAETLEGASAAVKASWSNLLTELGKDDGDVGARMGELVESAKTYLLGSIDEKTGEIKGGLIPRIQTIISNVAAELPTILQQIRTTLSEVLPQLMDVIAELLPIIITTVTELFGALAESMPMFFQTILPVLVEQLLLLIGTLTDNMPAMLDAAGQLFGMIGSALAQYGPTILLALGNLLLTLVVSLIQRVPAMLGAAVEFFKAVLDGFKQKWPEIKEWVAGVPSAIMSALGDLGSLLWNAGISVIKGLWDGMKEKAREAFDWVGGIADTIASLKGPIPYDKKVLVENGEALMQGLQAGISGAFDKTVNPYMARMASVIAHSAGDMRSTLSHAGSALINGLWQGMIGVANRMLSWVHGLASTIARLKGPLPYDRKVLIDNGMALMDGLQRGLQEGFESKVEPYVRGLAGEVSSGMAFTASVNAGGAGRHAPQLNLTIGSLTVRNRDEAEYFAGRINDIWKHETEGSLA